MSRVCLVNPPTSIIEREFYFPLALLALAGPLRQNGHDVRILDFDFTTRSDLTLFDRNQFISHAIDNICRLQPEIIGITSICSNFPVALQLIRSLRNHLPGTKIILGGPQPSSIPKETLRAFPEIDAIVIGEGEITFGELAASDMSPGQLHNIKGLAFNDGDCYVRTPKRPLIEDLNALPPLDYSMLPIEGYIKFAQENNFVFRGQVEVGRGCPFHCTFCSTSIMWERKFRVKSPGRILEEMRSLYQTYGLTYFELIHDNFTTSRKFVMDFASYFGTHNTFPFLWGASSRMDCIDEDRLKKLHTAGCRGLFFGIESGSTRMQSIIGKNLKLDGFDEIIRLASGMDIGMTMSFIMGFPEETEHDINQTILAAFQYKQMGATKSFFTRLAALAGTPVYAAHYRDLRLGDYCTSVSPFPYHSNSLLTLIRQHPELFSSFYSVPAPHLSHIPIDAIIIFFHALIGNLLDECTPLFEHARYPPITLFFRWLEWYDQFHPDEVIGNRLIIPTFPDFLKWLDASPA